MEEWKTIKGSRGLYQVSNLGNVKSFYSKKNVRFIKPFNYKNKYLLITITNKCLYLKCKLDKLVAEYFCENPFGYKHICHKDNNLLNCRADNLEWVPPTRLRTNINLSIEDVKKIYDLAWNSDIKQISLAQEYRVHPSLISQIKRGLVFRNITGHLITVKNNENAQQT